MKALKITAVAAILCSLVATLGCSGKPSGFPKVSPCTITVLDGSTPIEGVEIAVLIKCMDENFCRVSVRSKGLDVSKVAMKFGGGGHIRAAGFPVKKPLAEAKKDVLEALGEVLK